MKEKEWIPLLYAVSNDNVDIVTFLIDSGTYVNWADKVYEIFPTILR